MADYESSSSVYPKVGDPASWVILQAFPPR